MDGVVQITIVLLLTVAVYYCSAQTGYVNIEVYINEYSVDFENPIYEDVIHEDPIYEEIRSSLTCLYTSPETDTCKL